MRLKYKDGAQDALCVQTNYLSWYVVQDARSKESLSRRIMRLEPVFIYLRSITRRTTKILPKFAQTDNASLSFISIKMTNVFFTDSLFFSKNLFNRFDRFLLLSNSKFYLPATLSGLVRNFFFSIY